jgi:hypothetical protein
MVQLQTANHWSKPPRSLMNMLYFFLWFAFLSYLFNTRLFTVYPTAPDKPTWLHPG